MNFETLVRTITKTCHEAIDAGASIETVVAALHVVHESAMLTYKMHLSNGIAGDQIKSATPSEESKCKKY